MPVDPCTCTSNGMSGNVSTGIKGCTQLATSSTTYYCYTVDPVACTTDQQSSKYPGAGARTCDPTGTSLPYLPPRFPCFTSFLLLFPL
jgi:hypothetical protein